MRKYFSVRVFVYVCYIIHCLIYGVTLAYIGISAHHLTEFVATVEITYLVYFKFVTFLVSTYVCRMKFTKTAVILFYVIHSLDMVACAAIVVIHILTAVKSIPNYEVVMVYIILQNTSMLLVDVLALITLCMSIRGLDYYDDGGSLSIPLKERKKSGKKEFNVHRKGYFAEFRRREDSLAGTVDKCIGVSYAKHSKEAAYVRGTDDRPLTIEIDPHLFKSKRNIPSDDSGINSVGSPHTSISDGTPNSRNPSVSTNRSVRSAANSNRQPSSQATSRRSSVKSEQNERNSRGNVQYDVRLLNANNERDSRHEQQNRNDYRLVNGISRADDNRPRIERSEIILRRNSGASSGRKDFGDDALNLQPRQTGILRNEVDDDPQRNETIEFDQRASDVDDRSMMDDDVPFTITGSLSRNHMTRHYNADGYDDRYISQQDLRPNKLAINRSVSMPSIWDGERHTVITTHPTLELKRRNYTHEDVETLRNSLSDEQVISAMNFREQIVIQGKRNRRDSLSSTKSLPVGDRNAAVSIIYATVSSENVNEGQRIVIAEDPRDGYRDDQTVTIRRDSRGIPREDQTVVIRSNSERLPHGFAREDRRLESIENPRIIYHANTGNYFNGTSLPPEDYPENIEVNKYMTLPTKYNSMQQHDMTTKYNTEYRRKKTVSYRNSNESARLENFLDGIYRNSGKRDDSRFAYSNEGYAPQREDELIVRTDNYSRRKEFDQ